MGNTQGRPIVFTDEVNLDHFKLLRVVGKGAFGKVRIVERKDTGLTFALKYIRKDEGSLYPPPSTSTQNQQAYIASVVRCENVRNIIRERRMLEHLSHPFLCNLRYSFQDFEYLYLVVDLMNGGDLRFHISRKAFTEEAVRFWMAELGCALRYIHSQGVVHRDVKPDNVLLDSEGHIHLADFNVASNFTPSKPITSKSGTLAYLAPEVYEGLGYSSEVDWWSLGVTFYECIYNRRPFDSKDQQELADKIKLANPKYPVTSPRVDTTSLSAMQRLMEKRIHNRIGAGDFSTFTNHPFFLPIDFEALEQKQITPVFRPSSEKTNFDATYDLEELLLEEAPLEARSKYQKPRNQPRANASPQEHRAAELHKMIEELFESFDYTHASCKDGTRATGGNPQPGSETHAIDAVASTLPYEARATPPLPVGARPSRTNTLASTSARSRTVSLSGSPPFTSQSSLPGLATLPSLPDTKVSAPMASSGRPHHISKSKSMGGGLQSASDGFETSSDISDQGRLSSSRISSTTADSQASKGKPNGFLGFLSKKSRKGKSPMKRRPQENGVLGKAGARVVISGG